MRRYDGSMSPLPTALATPLVDDTHAANHDKTSALIATCSAMLLLALTLRILLICTINRKLTVPSQSSHRRLQLKLLQHALDVSVYIVLWYGISIGMTLFNKWFLRVWADGGYPFATTMTCLNMILKCVLSRLVNQCNTTKMTQLPRATYWKLAVPIGLCTSLDIMLSNLSFLYITVTFYTIVKSGANVWNLLFSIWLGHQRASFALFSVILLISSGIALASYGSTQFEVRGFILVVSASIIGTLRWVLTQSLLKEMDESSNRILAVVYYISPASAVGLLPIAMVTEGSAFVHSKFVSQSQLLMQSMVLIFVSGCFAFALIFVEILLVKKTSALSLGIAGSFKDVTQVVLAVFIFGDLLSPVNVVGLVVATCGMLLYAFIKHGEATTSSSTRYARLPTEATRGRGSDGKTSSRQSLSPIVIHMEAKSPSTTKSPMAAVSKTTGEIIDHLTRRESKEYDHDGNNTGSIQHV